MGKQAPSWLFPVKSLPKGYRWRDGETFGEKGMKILATLDSEEDKE